MASTPQLTGTVLHVSCAIRTAGCKAHTGLGGLVRVDRVLLNGDLLAAALVGRDRNRSDNRGSGRVRDIQSRSLSQKAGANNGEFEEGLSEHGECFVDLIVNFYGSSTSRSNEGR